MATLYWSPVTSKNWNVVGNWWTDAGCTVAAANVPWVLGDVTYLAYDLAWGVISGGVWDATANTLTPSPSLAFTVNALTGLKVLINGVQYTVSSNTATVITMSASGSVASGTYAWSIQSVTLNATILATAAGSCSLTVTNSVTINGGTFTGASFTNSGSGTIYGGTFTGASFTNSSGYIYGGMFTGASFTNSSFGYIYGGTFTGASFTNSSFGIIYGGTFTGASFTNSASTIYSGTFTGASFTNSSTIYGGTFTGASFTNSGSIYGGYWWLSGRMKQGANIYTASGDASPSAKFTNFYTDNASTIAAGDVVTGKSFTALDTTVNGSYPTTATTQAADATTLAGQKAYLLATQTVTFGASSVTGTLAANKVLDTVAGGTLPAAGLSALVTGGTLAASKIHDGTYGTLADGSVLVAAGGSYAPPVQAGYSALAAGYGAGGATSGTLAASKIMDGTYGTLATSSVLVAAGGTFDESARNVDPGVANVLAPASGGPTNYKIANSTLVGTATLPTAANTRYGSGAFGVGGASVTPTCHVPTAAQTFHGVAVDVSDVGLLAASNIGSLAGTTNLTAAMLSIGVTIDDVVGNSSGTTSDYLTVASLARQGAPPGPGLGID